MDNYIKIALALVVLAVLSGAAYLHNVPMSGWQLAYSSHAGGVRWNRNGVVWFPQVAKSRLAWCAKRKHNCRSAHYYWKKVDGRIRAGKTVTATWRIAAPRVTSWNYKLEPTNRGNRPASVSIILQHKNDNMYRNGGRFWTRPEAVLRHGNGILSVKLAPRNFLTVWGRRPTKSEWISMMQNIGRVGVTFGGGSFKGHGVNVTGGYARFQLKSFRFH